MNRQRTTDNGQCTFSDIGFRHSSLPVAHCSLLIAIIFILCSCSTNKNASSLRNLSANHIFREVEKSQFEFDNLEAKLGIKVKGDNNIGLKGQLRMHNDSVIWISVSLKLGIEVGRIMITEDSVKFINKTNRTYLAESIDSFKEKLPSEATMFFLQDLLVGNNTNFKRNNKFKVTTDDECYKLESNATNIWVTPKTFKVKRQQATVNGQQSTVGIDYDNFQEVNGKLLPTKITLDANDEFGLILEIDYSEIKVGEKLEFPFNISKKYSKI